MHIPQTVQNDITLVHLPVSRTFDSVTLTHEMATQALEVLVDPTRLPCLVHCYDGTTTTGLVVMCLRKLQGIGMPFAQSEFARFQRSEIVEPITDEERLFVESFKHDVRVPAVPPPWLWGGASGDPRGTGSPPTDGSASDSHSGHDGEQADSSESHTPLTHALHRAANESAALAVRPHRQHHTLFSGIQSRHAQ